MTTDPAPNPEAVAAVAEVVRLLNEARQASRPQFVCAQCRQPFPQEQLVAITPALCPRCRQRQGQRP